MELNNQNYKTLAIKHWVRVLTQSYGERMCKCGRIYQVKFSDLQRGWGLNCSKSCAAKWNSKWFQNWKLNPNYWKSRNDFNDNWFTDFWFTDDNFIH